jgi:hypothetical protein
VTLPSWRGHIFEAVSLTLLGVAVLWRLCQLRERPDEVGGRRGRRRGWHRRVPRRWPPPTGAPGREPGHAVSLLLH